MNDTACGAASTEPKSNLHKLVIQVIKIWKSMCIGTWPYPHKIIFKHITFYSWISIHVNDISSYIV